MCRNSAEGGRYRKMKNWGFFNFERFEHFEDREKAGGWNYEFWAVKVKLN